MRAYTGRDRLSGCDVALVGASAVGMVVMLEAMRVFVATMIAVIGQANRGPLALTAFAVFLAAGLGWGWRRWLGIWRGGAAALILAFAARGLLQFWQEPEARVWVSAATLIFWSWGMIALLDGARARVGLGLVIGLAIDLAIRIIFQTIDLPWMTRRTTDAVTIVLLLAGGAAAARIWRFPVDAPISATLPRSAPPPQSAVPLLAIGPAAAFYHLASGNLGLAQQRGGLDFPGAAAALAIGLVSGIILLALDAWIGSQRRLERRHVRRLIVAAGIIIVAVGAMPLLREGETGAAPFVVAAAGAVWLLGQATSGERRAAHRFERGVAFWFTLGLLLHAAVIFLYFASTGEVRYLVPLILLIAIGALAAQPATPARESTRASVSHLARPLAVAAAFALFLVCAWTYVRWEDLAAQASALPPQATVMTYNIQYGFGRDNRWDLERTARAIEAQQPDVVILQEVARGWLAMSMADDVLWLSRRLKMQAVFGPSSGDELWGNAILTRARITSTSMHEYRTTQNLKRGVLTVTIATERGDLTVLGTHLDNPGGAGEVRMEQTNELLTVWNGRAPAVIGGDFNVDPGADVTQRVEGAGLVETGAALGPNATTTHDARRIDYLFTTPDLTVSDQRIPEVWASDHKPYVIRIRLPQGAGG